MKEQFRGPLTKAYPIDSIEYKLAYLAFNVLAEEIQEGRMDMAPICSECETDEATVQRVLEGLYTENQDPDAYREEMETGNF